MLVEERRSRLLDLVRQRGFASLPELSRELDVSESTIRRDLDHLERSGAARRTHGGVFYVGNAPQMPPFEERPPAQWENKRLIAERTVELIEEGDTVLFDGGTTTYEIAQLLVGRKLQIVTNSLPIANLFASEANADLVLLGGYVYPRSGVTLGPYADATLAEIRVRKTIISVGGITDDGFYNSNVLLVETEKAMLQAADEIIVAADSSKFGKRNLAHLCGLADIDRLIVDYHLSEDWRSKLLAVGINLTVAGHPPLESQA